MNGRLFPFNWARLLLRMKKIDRLRMITMGVKPDKRLRGLETLLYIETVRTARELGYAWGEVSWILEDNHNACKAVETVGGIRYKTYRIYEKALS